MGIPYTIIFQKLQSKSRFYIMEFLQLYNPYILLMQILSIPSLVPLLLLIQLSSPFFLDFHTISSSSQMTGAVVKQEDDGVKTYYFDAEANDTKTLATSPSRMLVQKYLTRFETYFGTNQSKNFDIMTPQINFSWNDSVVMKKANEAEDMQGVKKMYKMLGVPISRIEEDYIPKIKTYLNILDYRFSYRAQFDPLVEKVYLYNFAELVKKIKNQTQDIVNSYMKDVKTVILGSRNKVTGSKVFISTDNMVVKANNTFIYNGNVNNNTVSGQNIMRTQFYEFNFDEIDAIYRKQVSKCIKLLL